MKYNDFENGKFCIDIQHAKRFDIASALFVTQFPQGDDRVFCRSFPSGGGYSRYLKDLLPICDADAMTIIFSAFKPSAPIPEKAKLQRIEPMLEQAKKQGCKLWWDVDEVGTDYWDDLKKKKEGAE